MPRPKLSHRRLILAALATPLGATAPQLRAQEAGEALQLRLRLDLVDPAKKTRVNAVSFGNADRIEGVTDTDVVADRPCRAAARRRRRVHGRPHALRDVSRRAVRERLGARVRDGNVFTGPEPRIKLDDYSGYFVKPDTR